MTDWEKSGFFKAFTPTKPNSKEPAFSYTKAENHFSLQEMQTKEGFIGLLADDAIMLDADTEESSEALMEIIKGEKLSCMVTQRENGRGIHALFYNMNATVPQNHTKVMLACGIAVDIKIGAKNGYDCLKYQGDERYIVYDNPQYQNLPKCFFPLKGYKADFSSLDEGDGRNQALFNYILTLQSFDFTNEEIRETIGILNKYVLKKPLSEKELNVILRDEAFKKQSFFKGTKFLHDKFATYLKNDNHIIKLNGQLHIYKSGVYVPRKILIEKAIILIIAVIAAIIGVCQWIAKATGVANSWFGVMTGGINVVIQFFKNLGLWVANIALGIWEAIGACCSNIGTAFHNTIANVQGWFFGLLSTALTVVEGICAALNKLPFVEFDYSGISAKADEYAAKSAEAYGSTEEYKSVADAFNSGFSTFDAFGDGWASDAFKAGASWGDGVADKVSGFFSGGDGSSLDAFNLGSTLDGVYGNTGDTAGNTAQMADSLSATEEDLKYLRDIAERETINRFTTAEITIEQTNNNTISSDMDIDGVMEKWNTDFTEILETAAEGVHE